MLIAIPEVSDRAFFDTMSQPPPSPYSRRVDSQSVPTTNILQIFPA